MVLRLALAVLAIVAALPAQDAPRPFRWNNPLPASAPKGVEHGTFHSDANGVEVGFNVLLPPGYSSDTSRRYPVVYYLHGGRPGGEHKTVGLAEYMRSAMRSGSVEPMIYVFVNGGKLSHYDHEGSLGETAFVRELIPHIDTQYRTIADRRARAVEGFSQGGRGTARIMFKHSDLFSSAAPMGGGHQHEKRIDDNDGVESDAVHIDPPWNNTWELARRYSGNESRRPLRILVVVGTEDQNYEANLAWMDHMADLDIDYSRIVLPGTPHSSRKVYAEAGRFVMLFHASNFREALGKRW